MNRYLWPIVTRAVAALVFALQQGSALCADPRVLFTEDHVVLANGVAGKTVHIDSGTPGVMRRSLQGPSFRPFN
jgi:hypothetical protein